METITPFLWFDGNAEEAINFYTSTFKNSSIGHLSRMGDDGPVFLGTFQLNGQEFMALNGGPMYKFSEAVSFFVSCETQEDVDYYWDRLGEGGEYQMCGWLKDKFGLSWQVIPKALGQLMGDPDPAKSQRVMQAMLGMRKIVISELQRAYDQE